MTYNNDRYAIIMAGGVGSRFWPESTEQQPKQFLDLTGSGKSLLRQTFERLEHIIPANHIIIVTNEKYAGKVKKQLPEIDNRNILLEPVMRNTAPAILYAVNHIHASNPDANIIVAPSDHFIDNEDAFHHDVIQAFDFASKHDVLITLGIHPDSPHTGYGYIQYDKKREKNGFFKVIEFTEKPDKKTAEKFLEQGNFLWNAGIFIWNVKNIRTAFKKYLPEMFQALESDTYQTEREQDFINKVFPNVENISIDYGIMEKAANVWVRPAHFGWNDLGSWDALYKQLSTQNKENISLGGQLFHKNATGNLIKTPTGKKIILSGLDDYLIIDSGEILMIIPKSEAQEVKNWHNKLNKK